MYHASGKPTLRTGSIIAPPPKVRAHRPYGDGISATAYGSTTRTAKHGGPLAGNGWTPALLRDVESRYARKATARKSRPKVERLDRAAAERKLAGTVKMAEVD